MELEYGWKWDFMNILFLTLLDFESLEEHNIYTDLLREFRKKHHKIYAISPVERKKKCKTYIIKEKDTFIVKLRIGNMQKINIIEKGISTITLESLFVLGIKKYFSGIHFDLMLYSTPPITFCKAIEYVKKRDGVETYLLLKDIFPQNAIDLGMMKKEGIKSILYKYFKTKEKRLYRISDRIGCMSEANVNYVINHNPEIDPKIVEICPNSIEIIDRSVDENSKIKIRNKYNIPLNKKIFVYGGNLGKPQGIEFLIHCIHTQKDSDSTFFLVIGDGTEYRKLEEFKKKYKQKNFKLLQRLSQEEYYRIVASCDVGMIFLDHRFTIPNFPSRLLDYMAAKLPVLAVTDTNTDVGKVIVNGGFGWWCESNDVKGFDKLIKTISDAHLISIGKKGYQYLYDHYRVSISYETILTQ